MTGTEQPTTKDAKQNHGALFSTHAAMAAFPNARVDGGTQGSQAVSTAPSTVVRLWQEPTEHDAASPQIGRQ
jgi:hypothetical protein